MCIVQLSPPYRPALQPFCRPALLSYPYRPGSKVRSPTALPYRHATPCFPCLPALVNLPYRHGRTVRSPAALSYRHATHCVPCLYPWVAGPCLLCVIDGRRSTYDVSVRKKMGDGEVRTNRIPSKATITNKTLQAGSFSSS